MPIEPIKAIELHCLLRLGTYFIQTQITQTPLLDVFKAPF